MNTLVTFSDFTEKTSLNGGELIVGFEPTQSAGDERKISVASIVDKVEQDLVLNYELQNFNDNITRNLNLADSTYFKSLEIKYSLEVLSSTQVGVFRLFVESGNVNFDFHEYQFGVSEVTTISFNFFLVGSIVVLSLVGSGVGDSTRFTFSVKNHIPIM